MPDSPLQQRVRCVPRPPTARNELDQANSYQPGAENDDAVHVSSMSKRWKHEIYERAATGAAAACPANSTRDRAVLKRHFKVASDKSS